MEDLDQILDSLTDAQISIIERLGAIRVMNNKLKELETQLLSEFKDNEV